MNLVKLIKSHDSLSKESAGLWQVIVYNITIVQR